MKARIVTLALLAVGGLGAATAPAADAAAPSPATLLFLAEARPLRVHLDISIAGESMAKAEGEVQRRLFAFFDRNRDGRLDRAELERLLRSDLLPASAAARLRSADFGVEGDATLTPEAFQQAWKRLGLSLVRPAPIAFADPYAPKLTAALFAALDKDRDGKVSRAEMQGAAALFEAMDRDEDECLTPLELLPTLFTAAPAAESPGHAAFVVLVGEKGAAAAELLRVYDRNHDERLSREEIGLDADAFTRADRNGDGQLDRNELEAWATAAADLELTVRLDRASGIQPAAPERLPAGRVHLNSSDRVVLKMKEQHLDVAVRAGLDPAVAIPGLERAEVLALLAAADGKKVGFVEAADVRPAKFKALRRIFDLADSDGSGKLTAAKVAAYLDLHQWLHDRRVTLALTPESRGWFEILDADGDGKLGVREMRSAWKRLADGDAEKSGFLLPPAAGKTCSVTILRGEAHERIRPLYRPRAIPREGPAWFLRMDRNGDDDVSLCEFLGTRTQFQKIDKDGDGLISLEEARAADPRPATK